MTSPAHRRFAISPARTEELTAAFQLIFRHLGSAEQETRVRNALELVRLGEVLREGILVARGDEGLVGVVVCLPVPGASGLVWPPQVVEHGERVEVEDQLIRRATFWLRQRGAKLAQSLLLKEEADLGIPLERNGFRHITDLWYMRHSLELPAQLLLAEERLTYRPYLSGEQDMFHETLLRTYEDTLDCPEVNGVREIGEIIEGHLAQGMGKADHWWLALADGQPVGVLVLVEPPDWNGWDIAYLGVVPKARGRGFGRELTRKALLEARVGEAAQLTLSVDARNQPAWNLYQSLRFEPFDQRAVYLAIWK